MQKLLRRTLYLGFWLLFTLVSGAAVTAAGVYLYLSPNLPNVDDLYEVKLQIPLRIYTSDGELIGEFGEKRRTPVTYEQIPQKFVNALLAAEDSHFETHSGVAIRGLLRATVELALTGEKQTGGSTLTMQVARNFFLSRERTFTRKFNEILLALEIERKLTKEQIFELYVNKIFWGNRAYGVEAAAKVYYGKSVGELTLAQCAMIAGLPKAPSTFNPIVNPSRALTRRNWILRRMLDLNYIGEEEHAAATEEPITAILHGAEIDLDAPYAAELARANLLDMFGKEVYGSGMAVYTTIDSKSQRSANRALRAGIMDYDVRHGYRGPEGHSFEPGDDVKNLENWHAVLAARANVIGMAVAEDYRRDVVRGHANGLQTGEQPTIVRIVARKGKIAHAGVEQDYYDGKDGDRLPGSPEQQFSLGATYSTELFDDTLLDINYGLTYQSDVYSKVGLRADGEALPGYALSNISARFSKDEWSVTLYMDNMFDKYAYSSVRRDKGDIGLAKYPAMNSNDASLQRNYGHYLITPRTAGVRFEYLFGL